MDPQVEPLSRIDALTVAALRMNSSWRLTILRNALGLEDLWHLECANLWQEKTI